MVRLVKEGKPPYNNEMLFHSELKIDQSISHNGVCLTVVEKEGDMPYRYQGDP